MVFLAETNIWQWILPISLGLMVGVLFSLRRRYDYSQVIELEAEEFRLNMRKGQLVDIRSAEAYKGRKINGSRNFPKASLFANLGRFRHDQAVFVYDEDASRQLRQVGRKLLRKGFKPVYLLKGGLKNWTFPLKENQ